MEDKIGLETEVEMEEVLRIRETNAEKGEQRMAQQGGRTGGFSCVLGNIRAHAGSVLSQANLSPCLGLPH